MLLKQELGKKIQALRKSKKLTQEKFAELIGIDPKNISKIENGRNYPSSETITQIAKVLGVDIYELFVFNEVSYESMREEIIEALNNPKIVLYLYRNLKNLGA